MEFDKEHDEVVASNIVLCLLHKTQLSPPHAELTE
jgi:hypothetical protein